MPQQDGMEQALRELRERILDCGGQAALLQITFCDEADEQALLQAFAEARSEEYAELRDDAQPAEGTARMGAQPRGRCGRGTLRAGAAPAEAAAGIGNRPGFPAGGRP